MKKPKLIALILASLTLVSAVIITGCKPRTSEEKLDRAVNYVSRKLDLTDDQKKRVEKIKQDILAKKEEFHSIRKEMHADVRSQLEREKVNTAYLKKRMKERSSRVESLKFFVVDKFAEFHSILTPEQKKLLAEKMDKYKNKGRCRW